MVRLLECQRKELKSETEHLILESFAIPFLCHILEILESDLTPNEKRDIITFIQDWCKRGGV